MGQRHVISQLETKYARLSGQRETKKTLLAQLGPTALNTAALVDEINSLGETLRCIEVCAKLFEPNWRPENVENVRTRARTRGMDHGSLLNMAFDVLRTAEEPPTTAEIVERLWVAGRISEAQYKDRSLRSALTNLLRRTEALGSLRSIKSNTDRALRWAIVPSPKWKSGGASRSGSDA